MDINSIFEIIARTINSLLPFLSIVFGGLVLNALNNRRP